MSLAQTKELSEQGWTTFYFDGDLLALASRFGTPVSARAHGPLLDLLKVKAIEEAHPNSLSSRYGTGAFPFHTDGAHHEVVPRYIFMRLIHPEQSHRKTQLLDFRGALSNKTDRVLRSEMWRVRGLVRPFLSPMIGDNYLRFDISVMRPAISGRKVGISIVEEIQELAPKVAVGWRKLQVLVLDNRRMLHGRDEKPSDLEKNEERTLERVLVV